jgi:hypothetical protein
MSRKHSFALGVVVASVSLGCGDQAASGAPASSAPASSGAVASASAASSSLPVATTSAAVLPVLPLVELPAGEPAIVEALTALASCEGLKFGEDCAAQEAWNKRIEAVNAIDDETESGKAERKRYAASCLASLRHASAIVREAAADCVEDYRAELADRKLAARALLAQIPLESSASARSEQISALERLDPTEHGLVPEVVALARPLIGKAEARRDLERLVNATRSPNFRLELQPAPEAISFAIELVRRREAVSEAIDVLTEAKELPNEACELLLDVASTRRGEWADASYALLGEAKRCEAQRERVVQLLVEVAKQPRGPKASHAFDAVVWKIASVVDEAGLSDEQKARLRAAAEAAIPSAIGESERESLEKLRDALKGG